LDSKQKRLYSKAGEAVQLYSYKTTEEGQRAAYICCTSSYWQERQDSKQKRLECRVQSAECSKNVKQGEQKWTDSEQVRQDSGWLRQDPRSKEKRKGGRTFK